jgi:hypothetical protein
MKTTKAIELAHDNISILHENILRIQHNNKLKIWEKLFSKLTCHPIKIILKSKA